MKIQQIRNATIKVTIGGKTFLVDPWFQKKGTGATIKTFDRKKNVPSPTVELPISVAEIMDGVDAIIVTHIHPDHFEAETAEMLDKNISVFAPDEKTAEKIRAFGYQSVTVLSDEGTCYGGITLTRTIGMHGKSPLRAAGKVCGIVLTAEDEKKLYIAGDTVYYRGVAKELEKHKPDIIVVNACGASLAFLGRIIMDAEDVVKVCRTVPEAIVIASHMEAVNHATVTRAELREYADSREIKEQLKIPNDGEVLEY